jgi:transposase-like protein
MEMATYLVTAVLVEGQSVRKVAQDHGVSKTWLYELVARYQAEGEAGLVPRSRRPHRSPTKLSDLYEDEIVRRRKELTEAGYDAGPRRSRSTYVGRIAGPRFPRARPSGGCSRPGVSSPPSRTSGRGPRGSASPPRCPMTAGKWASPT